MKKGILKNQSELAEMLRVVGDPQRLKLLCVLFNNNKKCVTRLAKDLSLSIALTSHHLRTLRSLKLLEIERDGKNICYSLKADPIIKDLKKFICKYINN